MNKSLLTLGLAALVAAPFSAFAEIVGEGTAENPYQIASADDLGKAYDKVKDDAVTYFVQTADIDMAGVEEYVPLNTKGADWSRSINYDGRNHVIKNFGPKWHADGAGDNGAYYVTSIFGIVNGTVKNLGVVDVNISTSGASQRAGVLCAYAGSSAAKIEKSVLFENVYITGKVVGGTRNTAGLGGINQLPVTIKNCYVNLDMKCEGGTANSMLIGELKNTVSVASTYLAGTVSGSCNFVFGTGGDQGDVESLVIFAEGAEAQLGYEDATNSVLMANTAATRAEGIEEVLTWSAFQANGEELPTLRYALAGSGTAADPYLIGSVDDLCNAWTVVDCSSSNVYFVQTADIDMEGVDEYHAIAGYNGVYNAIIHYDGQNHVISNFAPGVTAPDAKLNNYYCTTVFGVASGEIKNLGIVNAYSANSYQGNGILGAYAGHSNGSALSLENVFVQGDVMYDGEVKNYNGGMFGTTGAELSLDNCFANVNVSTTQGATYNAGLVGRLRNDLNLTSVYVAGSVSGGDNALVASTDGKTVKVNAFQTIAFNEGSSVALASTLVVGDEDIEIATPETKDMLIQDVRDWRGGLYSLTKDFMGYPALEAFENYAAGIFDTTVEEVEANGPAVYYNLQGVQVANPENGIYIVRRGNKVTKELIRK